MTIHQLQTHKTISHPNMQVSANAIICKQDSNIYVDHTNGYDSRDGKAPKRAVKTMTNAYSKLDPSAGRV